MLVSMCVHVCVHASVCMGVCIVYVHGMYTCVCMCVCVCVWGGHVTQKDVCFGLRSSYASGSAWGHGPGAR